MNQSINQILQQGAIALNNGNFEKAEHLYRIVLETQSTHPDANNNLGITLHKLNRFDEATISYKRAIKFNPEFSMAYNNLGITLKVLGQYDEAEVNYRKAIELKEDFALAHNNLGEIFEIIKKYNEAEISYKKAIELKPNYPEFYYNLGNMFTKIDRLDEAVSNYNKAILLKPNYKIALLNRGQILFDKGQFELSLIDFEKCNNEDSRSRLLASLYSLKKIYDIYQRINTYSKFDYKNIRIAAFSSFIEFKEKKDTTFNFCKNPIDFISYSNISSHLEKPKSFINKIINELQNIETKWEPMGKTTVKGFQSRPNLFINPQKNILTLKSIITNEIDKYQLRFKNKICTFIKDFPSLRNLACWHVILKKQGHQNAHIHPGGWLSGVIYLKVAPDLGKDEGAIEFSLNGEHYTDFSSPKIIYRPKIGDIVLFPSSLHHRTIPFTSDTDRVSIAFDLMPNY